MFWERFYDKCLEKGTKPNPVANEIGISSGILTKWKNNSTLPNGETLIKLADYFNCSVDYLLGRTDNPEINLLNPKMSDSSDTTTPVPVRLINYYYKLASAGSGQIIFDTPPTKRIRIPDTPANRHVDYAIGVNGSSMEPIYHNGDTLLVEMTDFVDIGEIGIFLVNGECYVKERQETELRSLNPEADNIPLDESARCMGKVVGVYTDSASSNT